MSAPGIVLLVRHAWAGERGAVPDDRARPLDERGRRQAVMLHGHLDACLQAGGHPRLGDHRDGPVLVSSPLLRCTATLAPMAAALGVTLATDDRLAELEVPLPSRDGWPDAAYLGARALAALEEAAARTPAGGALVLCAHGEILPAMVGALAGRGELATPVAIDLTAKRLPKGGTWLLAGGGDDGAPTRTIVELEPPA
ncbi:MAG: histidine phosphatase family protein [Nitriliruptoraceae bacterium]